MKPSLLEIHFGKAKGMPGEAEGMEEEVEYEVSPEEIAAAKMAMRAMKMGDAKGFARAICSLHDLHAEPDADDEEELTEEEY